MNRIATWASENSRFAWLCILLLAIFLGFLSGQWLRDDRIDEHLSKLNLEVERLRTELMAHTLNGKILGANAMLGLIEPHIKDEVQSEDAVNTRQLLVLLESIGRSFDASGVFVAAADGIARAAWDVSGKPSTGLNIAKRSYFQVAMRGKDSIYAAVGMNTGNRAIYFASPVFSSQKRDSMILGAVVTRTDLKKVDQLLQKRASVALLMTPQDMVFASYPEQWFAHLAGKISPEGLKAIRENKQFGNLFETKAPKLLPFPVQSGIVEQEGKVYAIARLPISWNDPLGDWSLLLLDDVDQVVPATSYLGVQMAVGLLVFLLGGMLLHVLRNQHARALAGLELEILARQQEESTRRKTQLAAAGIRLQQLDTPVELASAFLLESHRVLAALQGVVYVNADDVGNSFYLLASFACTEDLPSIIYRGEGLLGQCVVEGESRVIEAPGKDYWQVHSGLGEAIPAALLMMPIKLNERILGVVEIALLTAVDREMIEQFEDLVSLLAVNLEILGRGSRLTWDADFLAGEL